MLFNKRRQSKDSVLRADILELTQGSGLWMNTYSAAQFKETGDLCVDEDFLTKAGPGDYCFVENADIVPYAGAVAGVIIYRWNRVYPSDAKFPVALFEGRWRLESTVEFAGFSHDTITREVYAL